MSPVTLAWSAAWILMGAAAVIRLLRLSNSPQPYVRSAYRMLAIAAACLAVGGTAQKAVNGVIGGPEPLRIADLISLAALPALIIGLATITADRVKSADGRLETSRWRRLQGVPGDRPPGPAQVSGQVWPQPGAVLDSALLVVSLFTIGLVTLFGPAYSGSGIGRATFAVDLIRPVAGLLALGLVFLLLPRSPRLVALPGLALLVVTIGDFLAVGARLSGTDVGVGAHLALVIGLGLLALTPEPKAPQAGPEVRTGAAGTRHWVQAGDWTAQGRIAALATAVAAAIVIAGFAAFHDLTVTPAVAAAGAAIVLLLVLRLAWAIKQATSVTASAAASDSVFRTLADSTSDTVLICDLAGTIEYISPAVGDLGYGQTQLTGTRLADVVHPEDRPAGIAAMLAALRAESGTGTFHGRVRGSDGSWRQVSANLSKTGRPGETAKILITCHDDSELVALRQQVAQLTFHDGLTGLPNRNYLEDRVKDLSQRGGGSRGVVPPGQGAGQDGESGLAAILVGLDGHALMHDLGGQPGENLVVAQAGRRLRAAVPPGATVARWAGDQFAVLLGDSGPCEDGDFSLGSTGPVAELAARLAQVISDEPFRVADKEISLTAFAGVATCAYGGADQVLGNAQLAMAKARESGGWGRSGGSRVEIFGPQLQAVTKRRADLAARFGEAITDQQLKICYRPVADLASSRVTCAEVLVAWPVGGELISGDELLAIAEDAAMVGKFTDWVLREACHQVAAWRTGDPAIGLMVACSARQVSAGGFAEAVLGAAEDAGLPPHVVTLQVAERVLVDGTGPVVAELAGLRARGVRLAIDGFGTGYASLSYLRRLAVDSIKIDPSYIAGLGGDPTLTLLTSAIAGLGRDLGIEVIATGVESAEQVELLKSLSCGLGQGGWIAGPVPPDAVDPAGVGTVAGWTSGGAAAAGQGSNHKAGDPACSPAS